MTLIHLCQVLFIGTILWSPLDAVLRGRCNECLGNGVACLDEQRFATCFDGQQTSSITSCPSGYVCTDQSAVCLSTLAGHEPSCYEDNCSTCELTSGRFACIDETSYSFCFGSMEPQENSLRHCPFGYVCDLSNPTICSPEGTASPSCVPLADEDITTEIATETTSESTTETTLETSTEPSIETSTEASTETSVETTTETSLETTTETSSETTTETTTSDVPSDSSTDSTTEQTTVAPVNPNTFCSNEQKSGYFKDPSDTTCKAFILCYLLSDQYVGFRYTCAGYFNAATLSCESEKPDDCI